jgi:CheY-specific phosphatase CheX
LAPQDEAAVTNTEVVIAIISLVGQVEWSVFIGLPRATASALAAKFAGFEIPFESPDMGDAVGELANIIAGDVKARLDSRGVKADISLPTVIRAQDIHVLVQRNAHTMRNCFQSEVGPLWVGVTAGKGGFMV